MELKPRTSIDKTKSLVPNHYHWSVRRCKFRDCSFPAEESDIVCRTPKRKRKDKTKPPNLPKDAIYSILLHLPAKVLYDEMRLACREWYDIIEDLGFIHQHFRLSSTGILVKDRIDERNLGVYIERQGVELSLTDLKLPFPAGIVGSCRGTVLLHDRINIELLHLVNLVTKSVLILPPMKVPPEYNKFSSYLRKKVDELSIALAIATSGHYKVVHVFGSYMFKIPIEIMICTVGIDEAWRKVDFECNICTRQEALTVFLVEPHAITGFIYWWSRRYPFGFALDVSSENMYSFTVPEGYSRWNCLRESKVIDLESGLGFAGYNAPKSLWEIHELIDINSRKWSKICVINNSFLCSEIGRMFDPRPYIGTTALLRTGNGDFWFKVHLNWDKALVCFNPKHGYLLPCLIDRVGSSDRPFAHVNNLLSWKSG